MLLSAAILLASCQDAAPARKDPVVARVPGSFLHVAIDIPGFTLDDRNATILRKVFGDRGVLIGAVPANLTSVELLAEPVTGAPKTDEAWRAHNLDDSGTRWKEFEAAGFACGEISTMVDGSGSHEYHAFFVRGGYRFDLHAGEASSPQRKDVLTREAFVKMIDSVRFGVVRRGTWQQMPEATLAAMHAAISREDGWQAWWKEHGEEAKDDWAVQFAAAELARHFREPPDAQIPSYRRTIDILEARVADKVQLSPQETLALSASEDGFALALLDSGDAEKAIPHLERALAVAHDLTAPIRAGVTYNLACAHARLGHEEIAVARLVESEEMVAGALARAQADSDFDAIRESKRFREAVGGARKDQ